MRYRFNMERRTVIYAVVFTGFLCGIILFSSDMNRSALIHAGVVFAVAVAAVTLLLPRLLPSLRGECILEITQESVSLERPVGKPILINRADATSIVEARGGIAIKGRGHLDVIFIPRRCPDYDRLREELANWGVIQKPDITWFGLLRRWLLLAGIVAGIVVFYVSQDARVVTSLGVPLIGIVLYCAWIIRRSQFYKGRLHLIMIALVLLGMACKIVFALGR